MALLPTVEAGRNGRRAADRSRRVVHAVAGVAAGTPRLVAPSSHHNAVKYELLDRILLRTNDHARALLWVMDADVAQRDVAPAQKWRYWALCLRASIWPRQ